MPDDHTSPGPGGLPEWTPEELANARIIEFDGEILLATPEHGLATALIYCAWAVAFVADKGRDRPIRRQDLSFVVDAFAGLRKARDTFLKACAAETRDAAYRLCFDLTAWMYEGARYAGINLQAEPGDQPDRLYPAPDEDILGLGMTRWKERGAVLLECLGLIAPGAAEVSLVDKGAYTAEHYKGKYGIQPARLRKARQTGRIRGTKPNGRWFYPLADVQREFPDVFDEPETT